MSLYLGYIGGNPIQSSQLKSDQLHSNHKIQRQIRMNIVLLWPHLLSNTMYSW
jgi:hypothetical protein